MIIPWDIENWMSTDAFNDEEYRLFSETLTIAERSVLTPVLNQTIILRQKCNNIPFSRHGQICFPLKAPLEAQSLPWHQWNELPFIVMTFQDKLGNAHEAMVDMNKIRKAIHYSQEFFCHSVLLTSEVLLVGPLLYA